jgi:hypothetical protein
VRLARFLQEPLLEPMSRPTVGTPRLFSLCRGLDMLQRYTSRSVLPSLGVRLAGLRSLPQATPCRLALIRLRRGGRDVRVAHSG